MVRDIYRVRRDSDSSASASCKTGPSSNHGSARQPIEGPSSEQKQWGKQEWYRYHTLLVVLYVYWIIYENVCVKSNSRRRLLYSLSKFIYSKSNIRAAAFLDGLRGSEVPIFLTFDTNILYSTTVQEPINKIKDSETFQFFTIVLAKCKNGESLKTTEPRENKKSGILLPNKSHGAVL